MVDCNICIFEGVDVEDVNTPDKLEQRIDTSNNELVEYTDDVEYSCQIAK